MAGIYDITKIPSTQQQPLINWNSCTADEIKAYEEDGLEIPEQYLKWAEEMSAAMNVQDDVTYEMANNGTGNAAQDFKAQLADSGASLTQQGQLLAQESALKSEETVNAINQMAPLTAQIDELTQESQAEALRMQQEAQSRNAAANSLIGGNQGDKAEANANLAVADAIVKAGQSKIQGNADSLGNISATINAGATTSTLAQQYGIESMATGEELLGSDAKQALYGIGRAVSFGLLRSSKMEAGLEASREGDKANELGISGEAVAADAAATQDVAITNIAKEVGKIEDSAGGEEVSTSTEEAPTENAPQTTEARDAQDEEAEKMPTFAENPDEIITDPNEILKRKQKLGLV